jgi:hypothetical protein
MKLFISIGIGVISPSVPLLDSCVSERDLLLEQVKRL